MECSKVNLLLTFNGLDFEKSCQFLVLISSLSLNVYLNFKRDFKNEIMFSFEGDYKSKRTINLGGSSTRQNKDLLLKKAQLERKEREAERQRVKAAIRIQVSFPHSVCHLSL